MHFILLFHCYFRRDKLSEHSVEDHVYQGKNLVKIQSKYSMPFCLTSEIIHRDN